MRLFLILVTLISTSALFSRSELDVQFDCYNIDNPSLCSELDSAIGGLPEIKSLSREEGDYLLELRFLQTEKQQFVYVKIRSKKQLKKELLVDLVIDSSLDPNIQFEKIVESISKMLVFFAQDGEANNNSNGEDEKKESPWYVVTSLSGNYSGTGEDQSTTETLTSFINYSSPKIRLHLVISGTGYYVKEEKTIYTPSSEKSSLSSGVNFAYVYSLNNHFNVKLLGGNNIRKNSHESSALSSLPQNAKENISTYNSLSGMLTLNSSNFTTSSQKGAWSVGYELRREFHNYIAPENYEEIEMQRWMNNFWINGSYHFKTLDLTGGLSCKYSNDPILQMSLSSNVEVTYTLMQGMSITPSVEVSRKKGYITNPAYQSSTLPILMPNTAYRTSVTASLTFSYQWGNYRLYRSDNR